MKKVFLTFFIAIMVLSFALPNFAFAQNDEGGNLVPCGRVDVNGDLDECDFADFMQLLNNLVRFMVWIAVPIAVIMFSYAGFLYITAVGNPGKISQAHDIFKNVGVGFLIVLFAWVVVNTVVTYFINDDAGFDTYLTDDGLQDPL